MLFNTLTNGNEFFVKKRLRGRSREPAERLIAGIKRGRPAYVSVNIEGSLL